MLKEQTWAAFAFETPGTKVTVAWLAQLVERESAVWEVEGSSPSPDQHSGSFKNTEENVNFLFHSLDRPQKCMVWGT